MSCAAYEPLTIDVVSRPWLAPKPCNGKPGCRNPTKLYAAGWRCEKHPPAQPDAESFVVISGRLFDGTEFTR